MGFPTLVHNTAVDLKRFHESFHYMDRDKDGYISEKDAEHALRCLGFAVSTRIFKDLFDKLSDEPGKLSRNAYTDLATECKTYKMRPDGFKSDLQFLIGDEISIDNLRSIFEANPSMISKAEFEEFIKEVFVDGEDRFPVEDMIKKLNYFSVIE